jgi:hypothetical protein
VGVILTGTKLSMCENNILALTLQTFSSNSLMHFLTQVRILPRYYVVEFIVYVWMSCEVEVLLE